jgi:hypothetical protein
MSPLGRLAGAGWPNSGEPPPGLVGEGHGGDLGGTRVRFLGPQVGGRAPGTAAGGAPAWQGGRGSAGRLGDRVDAAGQHRIGRTSESRGRSGAGA